ncbi:MAG: ATP-binding protein, partial [Vibrionaceae bacterium]
RALDALRQPIESGEIVISRSRSKINFPAKFQLIGALNPCISGYTQGPQARQSTPQAALRYLSKLSGPFLDRFDLAVDMPLLAKGTLSAPKHEDRGASSKEVRARVEQARKRMLTRCGKLNSELSAAELSHFLSLKEAQFLENAIHQLGLSVRAYHRLIKVARTIADLNQEENIEHPHLVEALSYRAMDNLLKQLMMQIS